MLKDQFEAVVESISDIFTIAVSACFQQRFVFHEEAILNASSPSELSEDQNIHYYISHGSESLEHVEQLIRRGCDINKPVAYSSIIDKRFSFGIEGMTPLMSAIQYRNIDAVNALLKFGANPNFQIPKDCELLCSFNNRIQDKLFPGTTPLLFLLLVICEENRVTGTDLTIQKDVRNGEISEDECSRRSVNELRFKCLVDIGHILLSIPTINITLKDVRGTSPLSLIPRLTSSFQKYKFKELSKLFQKIVTCGREQCRTKNSKK